MKKALASSFAAIACCTQGMAQGAAATDPLELIARAERRFAATQNEDGILLLWDALELLRQHPEQPTSEAGAAAALKLLQANDPLHGDRLAAFSAFARTQVDLAIVYRGKKWYSAAAALLDVADRFDPTAGTKERTHLAAAKSKSAEPPVAETPTLLQRASVHSSRGPWEERGDTLVCGTHDGNRPWFEWLVDATHADCELSIEFCSSDPKAAHSCALLVGVDVDGDSFFYQASAAYFPEDGVHDLAIFEKKGTTISNTLGSSGVRLLPTADGYHRLTFRVQGVSLVARLDAAAPVEVKATVAPRGRFGVTVGVADHESVPITFRNLRIGPWPPPTDADVKLEANAATQERVTKTIDAANRMIKTKPEVATLQLRSARRDVATLPAGVLRSNLTKTLEDLLNKSDLLHARWKKVAQEGARSLIGIADRYAVAGQVRAAHRLVGMAAEVDPEGCAARLAGAKHAVEEWESAHKR